jgi:hypothetical protein
MRGALPPVLLYGSMAYMQKRLSTTLTCPMLPIVSLVLLRSQYVVISALNVLADFRSLLALALRQTLQVF